MREKQGRITSLSCQRVILNMKKTQNKKNKKKQKNSDRIIQQLLNSVIAKYRDLSII